MADRRRFFLLAFLAACGVALIVLGFCGFYCAVSFFGAREKHCVAEEILFWSWAVPFAYVAVACAIAGGSVLLFAGLRGLIAPRPVPQQRNASPSARDLGLGDE